jgi:hypothetical protein
MTREKVTVSMPPELAEAVRRKSEETSVPLSAAIQRLLAHWIIAGELPPVSELQTVIAQSESVQTGETKGEKHRRKR